MSGKLLTTLIFFLFFIVNLSPETINTTNAQIPEQIIYNTVEENKTHDNFSIPIRDIDVLTKNKISGYVYFGRDTCSFCQTFNTLLKAQVQSNPTLIIYKFDTDAWRQDEKFQDVLEQYHIDKIPLLIKIKTDGSFLAFEVPENFTNDEVISALHTFLSS